MPWVDDVLHELGCAQLQADLLHSAYPAIPSAVDSPTVARLQRVYNYVTDTHARVKHVFADDTVCMHKCLRMLAYCIRRDIAWLRKEGIQI
jgi:hypothetical protein